ncbi:hypothetical protein PROFUN_00612 [Planoprotostelium fungivorum]|uniref:Uncharacterized protein n=1 Tax=Planoprotostelium fungivorum TaxID=1890364 RepID=A0A2P6NTW9_9EUKA|nr:hypothetical protein PROFUN_00612 [Planoprotostelium fungivorum]
MSHCTDTLNRNYRPSMNPDLSWGYRRIFVVAHETRVRNRWLRLRLRMTSPNVKVKSIRTRRYKAQNI